GAGGGGARGRPGRGGGGAGGDGYGAGARGPMTVRPRGAGPDPLPAYLAERSWLPRPGPAFVMTAEIADLPASTADVRFSPEPDAALSPPLASGHHPMAPEPLGAYAHHLSQAPHQPRQPRSAFRWLAAAGAARGARRAARGGSCSRSRRATIRPARSTSGAASATRTGTTTCLRPERDTPSRCWDRHRVLATFVSMATRARNGSARPRGGLDEAAPETPGRRAAHKSPARQAPSPPRSGPN